MKNKEFRTLIAAVMLVSMVAGSVGTAPSYVYAAENQAVTAEADAQDADQTVSGAASDVKPLKDETVYAKIDESGTVKSVTVSDQLKNISGEAEVKDVSVLKNIENVKGDETFSGNGDSMAWDVNGADICYQGTTDKELPVGIRISYKLDGKEVTADEIEGKSGHLVIRYTYENKTENGSGETTPFLMATGLILDSDIFTNVTVTNGRLISDGERDIAVGVGFPSASSILGTEELDIPEYFEIEADVTDYEAVEGITVATNSVFNEIESGSIDGLDDLEDSMNTLQDAADQLVSGSGELRNGLDTLLSSSGTLTDGIGQLADGSAQLKNGSGALLDGADALAAGSGELAAGTDQLASGAKDAQAGAGALSAGLDLASSKVSGELLPGVRQLDAGVTQMQNSLGAQLPALCDGVSALNNGIAQVAAGAAALDAGMDTAAEGSEALNNGIVSAAQGAAALNQGVDALAGQTVQLQNGANAVADGAAQISAGVQNAAGQSTAAIDAAESAIAGLANIDTSNLSPEDAAALQTAIQTAVGQLETAKAIQNGMSVNAGELASGASGVAAGINSLYAQFVAGNDPANPTLKDAAGALAAGTSDLQAGSAKLNAALHSSGSGTTLKDATAALNAALNVGDPENQVASIRSGMAELDKNVNGENGLNVQVTAGVSALKQGTAALAEGVDGENGLASGMEQLSGGAKALAAGNTQLAEGLTSADAGAKTLSVGAVQLAAGAAALDDGAGALADGIGTLQTGSAALIDGVKQLDDGAVQLNEGMIQFNEEGIEKLVSVFDGDIEGLLDKVNSMLDASKKYNNYSGISEDMEGEVKFIFITEK